MVKNISLFFLAAAALNAQIQLPLFGVYDLASGDTFRLNLTNPANAHPTDPCRVHAAVLQPTGGSFACSGLDCTPPLGEKSFTLSPGTSDGLEFSAFGALTAWPLLTLPSGIPTDPCRDLTGSIEVYDTASKRTRLLDVGRGLQPNPPPIFPLAGLTSLDTMRVNLIYGQPSPPPITPAAHCTVQAAIQGADGTSLSMATMTLTPFDYTTLSYANASIAGRMLVRPVISTAPGDPCRNVLTTVELQDSSSGRTYALAPIPPPI